MPKLSFDEARMIAGYDRQAKAPEQKFIFFGYKCGLAQAFNTSDAAYQYSKTSFKT